MKKRFLSILLAALMVLTTLAILPVTVSAADPDWSSIAWLTNSSPTQSYTECFKVANVTNGEVGGIVKAAYATEASILVTCPQGVSDCSLGDGKYDVSGSNICLHASAFTDQITDVTITHNGGKTALTVYNKSGAPKESYNDVGEGTAESPYEIGTSGRLADFAAAVGNGNDFAGKYLVLTADIGTTDAPFTKMIGTDTATFKGTFDGAGHTVTINITSGGDNIGLFAVVGPGGVVKNLITKGTIATTHRTTLGGVVGQSVGTVINCASFANLSGTNSSTYVGGITGGNGAVGKTVNCFFGGTITSSGYYNGVNPMNYGTTSGSYYDSTLVTGGRNISGSTGLPTAQMKAAAGATLDTGIANNKALVDLLNSNNDALIGNYKWIVGAGYPELVPCYAVTNGTAQAAKDENNGFIDVAAKALAGETVTVTATPNEGYALKSLTVVDADGTPVAVTDNAFTMPAKNVTVTAEFDVPHTHVGVKVNGRAATDTEAGYNDYYKCDCGICYEDEACTKEIGDTAALEAWKTGAGAVPARGHEFGADHRCTRCHDMEPQYQLEKDAAVALVKGVYKLDTGTFDFAATDDQVRKNGDALYGVYELKFYRVENTIYAIYGGSSHAKMVTFTLDKNDKVTSVTTYDTMTEEVTGSFSTGKGANLTWLWILLGILLLLIVIYVVVFFIWKKKEELPDAIAFLGFLVPSYKAINAALFAKKNDEEK